jgi:hypothetical protein
MTHGEADARTPPQGEMHPVRDPTAAILGWQEVDDLSRLKLLEAHVLISPRASCARSGASSCAWAAAHPSKLSQIHCSDPADNCNSRLRSRKVRREPECRSAGRSRNCEPWYVLRVTCAACRPCVRILLQIYVRHRTGSRELVQGSIRWTHGVSSARDAAR